MHVHSAVLMAAANLLRRFPKFINRYFEFQKRDVVTLVSDEGFQPLGNLLALWFLFFFVFFIS